MLIGRIDEVERLQNALKSDESSFFAVYGRRRVGKTFLIKEAFGYAFDFHHTGKSEGGKKEIDLLIDRADDTVNLCEMKFSGGVFEIDKEEACKIAHRRECFASETGTRKAIFVTAAIAQHLAFAAKSRAESILDKC